VIDRIRSLVSRIRDSRSSGPISLPAPLSDNQYLAASANAGVLDRDTGAYDKYLFEDHEIPAMPYEAAVDNHLELMSSRLEQRFRRHLSRANQVRIRAQGQLHRVSISLAGYDSARAQLSEQLSTQKQILEGAKQGKNGVYWIGEEPILLSKTGTLIRLYTRYLVFLLVALVDAFIIWSSFVSINIRAFEALALTVPAVAAQVVFPHIAGTRFRLLTRGLHRRVSIWLEVLFILTVWLTFVYVISVVRVIYIRTLLEQSGAPWTNELNTIFLLLSGILITALGVWVMFSAIRENPHEEEALKLKARIQKFEGKLTRQARKQARAQEKLQLAEESFAALDAEFDTAIRSSRLELAEAAKSVYRRALINEMADPDFTKSYYQEDQK